MLRRMDRTSKHGRGGDRQLHVLNWGSRPPVVVANEVSDVAVVLNHGVMVVMILGVMRYGCTG